jgi:hypothetical protein
VSTAFRQPAAGQYRPPVEGVAGEIATMVIEDIKHASATDPRNVQVALGPSDIGMPCTRRLAYQILDSGPNPVPKPNSDIDPWASIIGKAVHTWMAETYEARNRALGYERFLVERRIYLPADIAGSCDLYDRDTRRLIDWKVTSLDNIRKYRKNGPGQQYRTQVHEYGLGRQLAGDTPEHVALVFLPRAGRIDGLYVWTEPYQPQIAVDAIKRYQATRTALWTLDPEKHPDRWALFPTADTYCPYCPWFLPGSTDLAKGCPGHEAATATAKKE